MIRTSYGVRFFVRASARSTFAQFSEKNSSWSATSLRLGVFCVNSYVAGKRKPSIPCACLRNCAGGLAAFVATA